MKTIVGKSAATPNIDLGPANPVMTCVVPMVLFMVIGLFEPTPSGGGIVESLGITYDHYPLIYSLRLATTLAVLAVCWPAICNWIGRPNWWPPLLGFGLVIPWVVLATLQREAGWTTAISDRSAFNPFHEFASGSPMAGVFLAVRGVGLIVVVPLMEELFLRGFLMRYAIREDFWHVPFGSLTLLSAAACAVYASAAHPSEAFAAVGWFAIISGIAVATRRPIDTILAHAATNLALGAYVLATGNWWLV